MKQNNLLKKIDQLHTTEFGLKRIKRNLNLEVDDVVGYIKELIQKPECVIYKNGKNWYCEIYSIRITINSYNYCIITAHLQK